MPERTDLPAKADVLANFISVVLDTSVGGANQQRVETTGYPSQEFDPWTGAYADGINPNDPGVIDQYHKSGADGVLDWVIIEVTSGTDIKSDTVKDQLQFAS
jgi:hypothetical protein